MTFFQRFFDIFSCLQFEDHGFAVHEDIASAFWTNGTADWVQLAVGPWGHRNGRVEVMYNQRFKGLKISNDK